jgi:hypothetical protein
MTDVVTGVVALIAKSVGSVLGSLMALAFMPPQSPLEALRRFAFAWLAGVIFAPQAAAAAGYLPTTENLVSAAALVALASWWAVGAAVRISQRWTPK